MQLSFIRNVSLCIVGLLLIAGCGSQQQRTKQRKTSGLTGALDKWSEGYLKNKEQVAQMREVREQMRQELPTTNIKLMDYETLAIAKEYYKKLQYFDFAIKCLERMVTLCKEPTELNAIRLELADLFFELGEFEKSGKLYVGYLEFYPGSHYREYVEYKAILSHFYLTLQSDRDQTETKNTLALTQSYLEKSHLYSQYMQDVQEIQAKCYARLVESEIKVCTFYLRRNNPKAAEKRLAYINEHFKHRVPDVQQELLALEGELNKQLGLPLPEALQLQESIVLADNDTKKSMVDRF